MNLNLEKWLRRWACCPRCLSTERDYTIIAWECAGCGLSEDSDIDGERGRNPALDERLSKMVVVR